MPTWKMALPLLQFWESKSDLGSGFPAKWELSDVDEIRAPRTFSSQTY